MKNKRVSRKKTAFLILLSVLAISVILVFSYNSTKLTGGAISKNGLVAYWNFNNGATTDFSGMNNHATLKNGAQIISYDINRGYVLSLDGADDYVLVKDSASLDLKATFSLAAWIYSSDLAGIGTIFSKDGWNAETTGSYNLYKNGASLEYETNNKGKLKTDEKLSRDMWHHVAVTYDAFSKPQMKMYINGELVYSGEVIAPSVTNRDLLIGRRGYTLGLDKGSHFNGMMDEMRIYNKVLSAGEIKEMAVAA